MCYVKYATIVSQFYHIIFVNSIIVKSSNPSLPPPPPVYVFKFLLISNIHETARFNLAGGGYNGNRYTRNRLVVPLINERQEDLSRRIFECTRITILVRSLRKSWQKLGPWKRNFLPFEIVRARGFIYPAKGQRFLLRFSSFSRVIIASHAFHFCIPVNGDIEINRIGFPSFTTFKLNPRYDCF